MGQKRAGEGENSVSDVIVRDETLNPRRVSFVVVVLFL